MREWWHENHKIFTMWIFMYLHSPVTQRGKKYIHVQEHK